MTSFFFRAVTSDGKLRTGTLSGDTDKAVARELRNQGLIPVYVGVQPKKSFQLKLPAFTRGRRRDVLFFTQELSTLLNAGVPLDRALTITSELTERPGFRFIVMDVLRVLKGGRSLADSLATHPEYFPTLYVNIVRAGEVILIDEFTGRMPRSPRGSSSSTRCRCLRGARCSTGWRSSSARATTCAAT